jgi:hypothetical protein
MGENGDTDGDRRSQPLPEPIMTYAITGLARETFQPLFGLSDAELAERGVVRRTATSKPGFPCRVSLEDAEPGDTLLLLNFESHSADTPYRSAYAIYVNESAAQAQPYVDALPPVFAGRPIALRIFDADGMLIGADLARDEAVDAAIRKAFDDPKVAYIHAHNAAHGCFAARVDRA